MNKKAKKIIVNSITFTRVLATFSMPIICNFLTPLTFLLVISIILLTDLIDGKLARKWKVSTVFGSLLDMGADKVFGIAIMSVLAFSYPIFIIPLCLELGIGQVNIDNVLRGNKAKSKVIGKIKMGVVGLGIGALLLIGATPEIKEVLSNINIDTFKNIINNYNIDSNLFNELAIKLDKLLKIIKEYGLKSIEFIKNNQKEIEYTAIPATIISETATLVDYLRDSKKVKNNDRKKLIEELKKYREYIKEYGKKEYSKEILFNKDYYDKTIDEPLIKKLMPNKNKKVDK